MNASPDAGPAGTPRRILVIGAAGQLGSELVPALAARYGADRVLATDLRAPAQPLPGGARFETLDVLDRPRLEQLLADFAVDTVYHLAATLSAAGEQDPAFAWRLNMDGLFHVLDLAVARKLARVFWPSSIAAFGPNTPRVHTPQHCVMDPTSMYGITKLAGERLCEYYHTRHGLDVRSLRYPGLISYVSPPGGGTTDYAVHIFHAALAEGRYTSFLGPDTELPMMYMPDAVAATIQLMEAPPQRVRVRSSYNLAAISFTPAQIAAEIQRLRPDFRIDYAPDYRQRIADSWPRSIDDSVARTDWGWQHRYDLPAMTRDMLTQLASTVAGH